MEDPEDPARFLAERIRTEHALSPEPTLGELLRACRHRGVLVTRSSRTFDRRGVYIRHPEAAVIILHPDSGPKVLAHELYHHLVVDNAECEVVYTFPYWIEDPVEAAAERFAAVLFAGERDE